MGFPLLLSAVTSAPSKSVAKADTGKGRYTVLIGAILVQIVLGTIYAFSVFVGPLEAEFTSWTRSTTQLAYSLALASFALAMIPAGRLQDRIGPRIVAMIGGALLGIAFILAAVLVAESRPWALYLTYGIIGGSGIGFAYVCPIAAAGKWFPDKKGLITGVAVAGFGAGALFFAGPASALLMPPPADGNALGMYEIVLVGLGILGEQGGGIGWQRFFVLHGIVAAALVILGALLLRNPPAGWAPAGWSPKATQAQAMSEKNPSQMLDTPLATLLWMTFIFSATSGLMAIGQWTPMMAEMGQTESLAPAWMGSTLARFLTPVAILAIFNAAGRIFWGKVSDVIDRPRAMMIMFLIQGITFMLLVSVSSTVGVVIVSMLVGLNFGGIFSMFPSATSDYFGLKNYGANYGIIFTAYGVAGILGPIAGSAIYDQSQEYILAFVFAGILCFVAALAAVLVWNMERTERLRIALEAEEVNA